MENRPIGCRPKEGCVVHKAQASCGVVFIFRLLGPLGICSTLFFAFEAMYFNSPFLYLIQPNAEMMKLSRV
jgi:hypothetical protein